MANNDTLPFVAHENFVPSGAASVSDGVAIQAQATRMGLVLVASLSGADPLDGSYTVIVETADEADPAANTWSENPQDAVTFNGVGTYTIEMVQTVLDQVRIRVETDASNPEYLTIDAYWLSDTELTLN